MIFFHFRIFAEFDPVAVEMIDEVSCNVVWDDRFAVAKVRVVHLLRMVIHFVRGNMLMNSISHICLVTLHCTTLLV